MAAKITALQRWGCAVVFPPQRFTMVLIPTRLPILRDLRWL